MPGQTAGLTVGVKGEKEFLASIKSLNEHQKTLRSEMELVKAQFEGNEDSTEALTAKSKVLDKQLKTSRDSVEMIKAALENSKNQYGENSTQTEKWTQKLNRAEAQLLKTENELDRTEEAMEETTRSGRGLGDMAGDLASRFGIQLPEGITKSLNNMMSFDAGTLALVGSMGALVTAVANVEKKLVSLTKEQAAVYDGFITTSTVTGISVEKLQEYSYAAELVDVSVETLTGAQTKLINTMDSARGGTGAAAEAYQKLGIEVKNADGTLRDADTVFWETIDALGRIDNETERDAIAMDILGKSARDLNPLISAGADTMRELAEEAKEAGYVLSKEDVKALGEVDDAMQKLKNSTEAAKKQIAAQFAPYLTQALTDITKLIKDGGKALKDSKIVDSFGMLLTTVTDIINPVDKLSASGLPRLTNVLYGVAKLCASIADTVGLIGSVITLDLKGIYKYSGFGYNKGIYNNYQQISRDQQGANINSATIANGYGQYYANGQYYASYDAYLYTEYQKNPYGTFDAWKANNGYNAAGTYNWRGGLTWVGENGPELAYLPQGSQIMSASESREYGDTTIYVTIDAKNVREFNDIINMAQNARINSRKR